MQKIIPDKTQNQKIGAPNRYKKQEKRALWAKPINILANIINFLFLMPFQIWCLLMLDIIKTKYKLIYGLKN